MCASPLSPRHAQPDWMGGGLVSRQMMHAPPSAAILLSRRVSLASDRRSRREFLEPVQISNLLANKFIFFSIRNSQFANKIRVCFVLIRVVFSAPFNRARIHLFFQFSKPIPDFQLSKRSRNHEINPQKEGLIFEDFDRPQK
jgi:hypothetical protein